MKVSVAAMAITALAAVASSSRQAPPLDAASATAAVVAKKPSSNPDDFRQYRLKTALIAGTGPRRFDGLYVYSYHTGAGLGDAGLAKRGGRPPLPKGFMNGTYQQFRFDEGGQPYFPWGMYLPQDTPYAGWQTSQINTGYGAGGFFLNGSGLQYGGDGGGFDGWRVCDWWHNVPQLFWKLSYYHDADVSPASCADVMLMPEYV